MIEALGLTVVQTAIGYFLKQAIEIVAGVLCQCCQALAAQIGYEFGCIADVGRFVLFAAFGNRREEGGIGFYQDSIGRDVFGGFLYQRRVFKRHNAGEVDVHA